jgi:hypothetical protein
MSAPPPPTTTTTDQSSTTHQSSSSSTTTTISKRKQKQKSTLDDTAPTWHPFLSALHALQDDDANKWPFDLELQSEFTDATDAADALRAWTDGADCSRWPIAIFGCDGTGSIFALFKDTVVCMGSEGGVGAFGDLATFALLLAHRIEVGEWLVDSVDDAARYGYGEIDVDDVPILPPSTKSPCFAAIALLAKEHFDVDANAMKLRTVLDRVDKPLSVRQFAQFVAAKLKEAKKGKGGQQ